MKATIRLLVVLAALVGAAGCSESTSSEVGQQSSQAGPPKVVSLEPANGAVGVSPGLVQAVVTFDQPMDGGMSFTTAGGPEKFPELVGQPQWLPDKTTIAAYFRLEPNREYVIGLNVPPFENFASERGERLEALVWTFHTGS